MARGTTKVDGRVHPRFGSTQIHIVRPDGRQVRFMSLANHCADGGVRSPRLPVHDSAYIGYGRDGFYFDWPGRYAVTAVHRCTDQSVLVSNTVMITVEAPIDSYDAAACELFLGDEVGQLLAMLGSDSDGLGSGRDAMAMAIDRFPEHRLTDYARLVVGINAARPFKRIVRNGRRSKLAVRPVAPEVAITALFPLVRDVPDRFPRRLPLDPISLAMVATRLGKVLRNEGRHDRAQEVAAILTARFERQGVSASTRARIAREVTGRRPRQTFTTPIDFEEGEG